MNLQKTLEFVVIFFMLNCEPGYHFLKEKLFSFYSLKKLLFIDANRGGYQVLYTKECQKRLCSGLNLS